jgi:hypothetical protein
MPLQAAPGFACSAQLGARWASAGGLESPPTAGARVYPSAPHTVARGAGISHQSEAWSSLNVYLCQVKCDSCIAPAVDTADGGLRPRRACVRGLVENGDMASLVVTSSRTPSFRRPSTKSPSIRNLQKQQGRSGVYRGYDGQNAVMECDAHQRLAGRNTNVKP